MSKNGRYTPFRCRTEAAEDGAVRVEVEGEIDVATVDELARCLAAARRGAPTVVMLDLRGVTFIGSSGINLLAAELPAAFSGAAGVEVQTTPGIDRVLRLARISDPFAAWNLTLVPRITGAVADAV